MKALLGRKIGMTQLFDENGNVARVTIVEAGPCTVTQVKTEDLDGYSAIQIGFGENKKATKPQLGHASKVKKDPKPAKHMREVKIDASTGQAEEADVKVGDQLNVNQFEIGDQVIITGTSKGKGFAGTVKRHNFNTGPKSHGSHNYRNPGSIGSGYPQHVFKGIKMAGRMGGDQVTTKGLKVVQVDSENNLLAIKGSVPGPRRSVVMIRGAI